MIINLCQNTTLNAAYIEIKHESTQTLWYLHLKSNSVPQWLTNAWQAYNHDHNKPALVVQGQFLGELRPGNLTDLICIQNATQTPTTAHLHLGVPGRDFTISNWRINASDRNNPGCFKKKNELPGLPDLLVCANQTAYVFPSNTIGINCDANQPDYIGSRLCRRSNTIIRPQFPRESIEFFDKPYGSNTGEIALGTIKGGGVCKVIGGPTVNGPYIGWQVVCPSESVGQIYQPFDMRNGVWVNESDIEEITRSSFNDVQFASSFFAHIELSKYFNIFHGFSTGKFGYQEKMTRGNMALTTYRTVVGAEPTCTAIHMTADENGACTGSIEPAFYDVTAFGEKDHSENIAIQWMAEQEPPIVNGTHQNCPENSNSLPCFFPANIITRGEFTKITMGTFRTTDVYSQIDIPPCLLVFTDVEEGNSFKEFIDEACGLGFFQGYEDNGVWKFGPNEPLLREHGAKMLWRIYYELRSPQPTPTPTAEPSTKSLANSQSTTSEWEDNPDFTASQEVLDLRWGLMSANRGHSNQFCQLYFVNNSPSSDSQLGLLNFAFMQDNLRSFGPLYEGLNFASFEIDPVTKYLYTVTGDHGNQSSRLFKVDPYFGNITLIDAIHYADGTLLEGIDSLAFLPNGELYGYANKGQPENRGIVSINPKTAVAQLLAQFDPPAGRQVEGMAYDPQNNKFWLVAQKDFYSWQTGGEIKFQFKLSDLPGIVKALEFLPNGLLLAGIHHGGKFNVYSIDSMAGDILTIEGYDTGNFDDIVGLAFPEWCETGYPMIQAIPANGGEISLPNNGVDIIVPANQTAEIFSLIQMTTTDIPLGEVSTNRLQCEIISNPALSRLV